MLLAVRNLNIFATVPFYGSNPPLEELARTNAAILNIIPSEDAKRVAMAPDLEAAMQQYGKVYKGVPTRGPSTPILTTRRRIATIPKPPQQPGRRPSAGSSSIWKVKPRGWIPPSHPHSEASAPWPKAHSPIRKGGYRSVIIPA